MLEPLCQRLGSWLRKWFQCVASSLCLVEKGRVVARVVAKEEALTRVRLTGFLLKIAHLFRYKMIINARHHDSKAYNNNVLPNIRPLMGKQKLRNVAHFSGGRGRLTRPSPLGIFKNNTTEASCCISKLYNKKYVIDITLFLNWHLFRSPCFIRS